MSAGTVNHLTHPWKVEAREFTRSRSHPIGRAMFKTRQEAESFADPSDPDSKGVVLPSKPGDVEFA